MKRVLMMAALAIVLAGCQTYGLPRVAHSFGRQVSYGKHPGIDYAVHYGRPVIAVSDGVVSYVGGPCPSDPTPRYCGGELVMIQHFSTNVKNSKLTRGFRTQYSHLSKIFVDHYIDIKRGDLIGLVGRDNGGWTHLHFSILKPSGSGKNIENAHNPKDFWLNGKAECFSPEKDYSSFKDDEITLPIACGEHAKELEGTN